MSSIALDDVRGGGRTRHDVEIVEAGQQHGESLDHDGVVVDEEHRGHR
jgi:hypothetical protein